MNLRKLSFLLYALVFWSLDSSAQISGANVFLQGNYVEVGIAPNGAFGTTVDAPFGYHARPYYSPYPIFDTGTSTYTVRQFSLGFVSDYGKDGWTVGSPAYFGDYFVPSLPQEGFSIQANGIISNAWTREYITNHATGFTGTLYGANNSYNDAGGIKTATWLGSMGNLSVKQTTRLNDTDLFFTMSVVLKNTGTTTINDVFYLRTVDADNDWALTGLDGTTINKIQHQLPNAGDKVLVTARGAIYPNVYLGLGTRDCRAKVFYLDNGQVSPPPTVTLENLYDGIPSAIVYQNGSDTADQGIGIVFDLGDIAAGDSVTFSYAYILREADLDVAINQTQPQLAHNGVNYSSGDTIKMCQNGSGAVVDIINGDFFNWTWSPSTGLATTSGTHNTITLTSTTPITYTLTGASSMSSLCASEILTIRVEPNITPQPTVTPITYCLGQTAQPLAAVGSNILWYTAATGGTGVVLLIPPTAVAGTFTYYATQTINGCESARVPVVVTVYAPPAITIPPQDDTACVNGTADFSVLVTGGNLGYQWQSDDGSGFTNITDNTIYSGTNTSTLTLANIPGTYNGYRYRCLVNGLCSAASLSSPPATLQLTDPANITSQPSNTIICVGLDDTLTITSSGLKLNYQWQYKTPSGFINLTNSATYSGVTTPSLIITGATVANAGDYRCIVNNECSPPDTSDIANVRISTAANIWRQSSDQYICEGTPLDLDVQVSGPILSFQWQINDGRGWKDVINTPPFIGAKSNLLRISSVDASLDSVKFRCIVFGECITVYSNEINILLYAQPRITKQPLDATVINNTPATFRITTTGVGIKYRWLASYTGNSFAFINDNSVYSGTKTPLLTINNATYAQNGMHYLCLVEETGGCNYSDTTSDTVQLWVNPPTTIKPIEIDKTFIIYPNPVESGTVLNIQSNLFNKEMDIIMINSIGQKVIKHRVKFDNYNTSITLPHLAKGVYIVQFINEENEIMQLTNLVIQ